MLVTGGLGFIGSHIVELLVSKQAKVTVLDHVSQRKMDNVSLVKDTIRIINGDCTDNKKVEEACEGQSHVLNLAAYVGGIEYNRMHNGSMLMKNLQIASTVIEAAKNQKVERFLVVSSACVYPHDARIPTPESEGFRDEPESTNGGYGWSKRAAELLGKYYAEEFGMKIAIVRPYNAYGPRDHFDPDRSHVIPSLIRRVFSEENPIIVWGSGKQSRSFLYVTDLAQGMIKSIELYPNPDPINLGTDEEITISELISLIIKISGEKKKIIFDISKPDGSPRRSSDNTKAADVLSFEPSIALKQGIFNTINWYKHSLS